MNFKFFNSCDEFLDYYFENNMNTSFELVMQQLEKDECYFDDDWIHWIVVEFEEMGQSVPLAVIGVRNQPVLQNSDHISTFEVNINYRDMGFGKMILKEFMDTYCKDCVTLYAEEKNRPFYEKLGFKNRGNNFYIRNS